MAQDYASKIKALLANAEDPNLAEEARASYLAKAQHLMTRLAIDEATVAAAGGHDVGVVAGEE